MMNIGFLQFGKVLNIFTFRQEILEKGMTSTLKLKYNKNHTKQKRTIYSIGKIESGLSYNLTKKLSEGISISNQMIKTEISKNKKLKRTIRKLKKDLEELRINKGRNHKYKKLKTLITSKKEEYEKTKVNKIKKPQFLCHHTVISYSPVI